MDRHIHRRIHNMCTKTNISGFTNAPKWMHVAGTGWKLHNPPKQKTIVYSSAKKGKLTRIVLIFSFSLSLKCTFCRISGLVSLRGKKIDVHTQVDSIDYTVCEGVRTVYMFLSPILLQINSVLRMQITAKLMLLFECVHIWRWILIFAWNCMCTTTPSVRSIREY